MANVFVEARPKGRPEGSPIEGYVVEDHADDEKLCDGPHSYVPMWPVLLDLDGRINSRKIDATACADNSRRVEE